MRGAPQGGGAHANSVYSCMAGGGASPEIHTAKSSMLTMAMTLSAQWAGRLRDPCGPSALRVGAWARGHECASRSPAR
jgi:hypothetical protein